MRVAELQVILKMQTLIGNGSAALAFVEDQHQAGEVGRVHIRPPCGHTSVLPQNAGRDGLDFIHILQATLKDFRRSDTVQRYDFGPLDFASRLIVLSCREIAWAPV